MGFYICLVKRAIMLSRYGTFLLHTLFCATSLAGAQQPTAPKHRLEYRLELDLVEADFKRAAALYQLDKYKLGVPKGLSADAVFYPAFQEYEALYDRVTPSERPEIFTAAFYAQVIAKAQYFRNAAIVSLLMEHEALLHPRPPEADPKHVHGVGHSTELHHTQNDN